MMKKLLGEWSLTCGGGEKFSCSVPCSYYDILIQNGKAEHPHFRTNEKYFKELFGDGGLFETSFSVSREELSKRRVELVFEGIDTLSKVYLNGTLLGETDNMHRVWRFDVKELLREGENLLEVDISSAVTYFVEKQRQHPLKGNGDTIQGFPHLRKASYMMGWDWGPTLPDLGIWKPVYLLSYDSRIENVEIRQVHNADGSVTLGCKADVCGSGGLGMRITATDGSGREYIGKACRELIKIQIDEPKLWWPNGYGEQELYTVTFELLDGDAVIDKVEKTVGLRTLNISQQKDEWGNEFCFIVNGTKIFSMGANYIPEENMMSLRSEEKTADLIRMCKEANFNTLRVWGGGIYPDDWFFDLCDRNGIIVWLDFMFACSSMWLTDKMKETIRGEVTDNLLRIRHHASLGLLCGNNECEQFLVSYMKSGYMPLVENDYLELYCHMLPDLCDRYAPDTFYWSSSPSAGTPADDPNGDNAGDRHIWTVWSGLKAIDEYKKTYPRFCSEFGFESFPDLKTVENITLPEDRNLFSEVMEAHQKHKNGNGKLMFYIAQYYDYPTEFPKVIYATQLMQERAIRTAVEHFRRNRGRCMGSLYWQLNDCWPVASWAAIDYYHRPKALYYGSKRFFAPVLLSADNNGERITLNVSSERREGFSGKVKYRLKATDHSVLWEREVSVELLTPSAKNIATVAYSEIPSERIRNTFLEYELYSNDGKLLSRQNTLFVRPKQFDYPEVELRACVTDEGGGLFRVDVSADRFARKVQLSLENLDTDSIDRQYFDITDTLPTTVYIAVKDSAADKEKVAESLRWLTEADLS
ncbi:MAG: glycoside hydrolase family 2 protein [Clostridia bacterium]|nr:glycoside hydrolase family 2 protein [Clostridia bacterium]